MTEKEEIIPTELTSQLCPWKLSKLIVKAGGCNMSYFKWVHPYRKGYLVNKRKYIYVEWYQTANRKSYPAYTLSELLYHLPDGYATGYIPDGWCCKGTSSGSHVNHYSSAVEACAHSYIEVLKEAMRDK